MRCALIMAGGIGTRFWPKSTVKKPKQFINLINEFSMLQLTVSRIKNIFDIDKIFISTSVDYKELVMEQLPELPEENIIIEPMLRNTAPCILLSCFYIKNKLGNCDVAVFPADHIINDIGEFNKTLNKGISYMSKKKSGILTLGILPNRAETGYGYIKINDSNYQENKILKVLKFVEKPNLSTARRYLKSKNYLWNTGIFIFNIDYLIEDYKVKLPNIYSLIVKIFDSDKKNYYKVLNENYEKCEKISFDYGIIERNEQLYVLPSEFDWDDIGTWESLERYIECDKNNNLVKGDTKVVNSHNCIVYGNDKKIVLVDVKNIYCIDSDDLLIIGPRNKINDVSKTIQDLMKK